MATQLTEAPTRRSITATRPLMGWRTVDILTIAFLGAALGVAFWGWGVFYNGPLTALKIGYAPLMGLFVGPWFLAGVVGGLVVRRPGAALFCEVVAALVSMLPGTEWGATVLVSGILQGLGAELAFAILGYSAFGAVAAALAGVLSAPLEWAFEVVKFPASWADVPVLRCSLTAAGGTPSGCCATSWSTSVRQHPLGVPAATVGQHRVARARRPTAGTTRPRTPHSSGADRTPARDGDRGAEGPVAEHGERQLGPEPLEDPRTRAPSHPTRCRGASRPERRRPRRTGPRRVGGRRGGP